jgi:hypothetical protein
MLRNQIYIHKCPYDANAFLTLIQDVHKFGLKLLKPSKFEVYYNRNKEHVDQDFVSFLTEILRKTFEEQRNNFTTDMEEGRKMLKELSGKIKEYPHIHEVFPIHSLIVKMNATITYIIMVYSNKES